MCEEEAEGQLCDRTALSLPDLHALPFTLPGQELLGNTELVRKEGKSKAEISVSCPAAACTIQSQQEGRIGVGQ